MTSTTPKEITQDVHKLCAKIGFARDPVFVDVRPELWCEANECFPNIKRKIAQDGGSLQHGWTIWEAPGKLIEGEFHAVWVSPSGTLVDITPKADGETRILFLPDDTRVYNNEPVDNIRMALCNAPQVAEIIRRGEAMTGLRKKYNVNGQAHIPAHEALETIMGASAPIRAPSKVGRNDPCPCGSGKKFKKCCGQ